MKGRHVALLRGINVGGKHRLLMKDLAGMFEKAGSSDVRTYIQSGNVVFRADERTAARIPQTISAAIEDRFGMRIPIVTRTQEQFQRAIDNNPFLTAGVDPSFLHVMFLWADADTAAVDGIPAGTFLPDQFVLAGSELYLHLPSGAGGSKLPLALESKLGGRCTMRNWRTSTALLGLLLMA